MGDPFEASFLSQAEGLFAKARSLSESQPASTSILPLLDSVDSLLNDLETAVAAARADAVKFALDGEELDGREAWVKTLRESCQNIRQRIGQKEVKKGNRGAQKIVRFSRPTVRPQQPTGRDAVAKLSTADVVPSAQGQQPTAVHLGNMAMQKELVQEQDSHLAAVSDTVNNLKHVAITLGNELDDQARLLVDLEDDVGFTHTRLETAMARVNQILRSDSGTLLPSFGPIFQPRQKAPNGTELYFENAPPGHLAEFRRRALPGR